MNFIDKLKLSGKYKYFLAGVIVLVAFIITAGILLFMRFKPVTQQVKSTTKPTVSAVAKAKTPTDLKPDAADKTAFLKKADDAVASYNKNAKGKTADASTIKQIKYETVYNEVYSKYIKNLLQSIKVEDADVKTVIDKDKYNKLVKIITVQPTVTAKMSDADKKPYTVQLYKSDSTQLLKVGQKYSNGTVTAMRDPTTAELTADARGYLVSLKAVGEIDSLSKQYLGLE